MIEIKAGVRGQTDHGPIAPVQAEQRDGLSRAVEPERLNAGCKVNSGDAVECQI
jgi:hypothetical protein